MNEKAKYLFFCMIFVGAAVFGQNNTLKLTTKQYHFGFKPPIKTSKYQVTGLFSPGNSTMISTLPVIINKSSFTTIPLTLISADFYTQHIGFFCKKELQFEKITTIPFKFRLGSVQQCDWLEGKLNAVK